MDYPEMHIEKQRTSRGYDFAKVSRWFAERSDLILLLFDCSKLDISDEFKSVIEELQPHEDKVHCVLNKADQLDQESLMRVYGALLWSMGRIFKGAEVTRIYVGSFRDEPIVREEHKPLFDKDKSVLMAHLEQLPKACSMRKINEMVKRIRLAVVHVCVVSHLKSKMPVLWGKEAKQAYLIEHLQEVFADVRRTYQLAEGDFPRLDEYKAALQLLDMSTFARIDRKTLTALQDMLLSDIPKITAQVAGMQSAGREEKDQGKSGEEEGDDAISSKQPQIQWAEKQASSFTDWMNFVLNQSQNYSSAAELDENLTESESLGICQLAKKQAEVKTRQAAVAICRTSQMVQTLCAVKEEINIGKLSVREDRDVLQDLGLQEALFGILFSYEPRWLCLGLGVLFGKSFLDRSQKSQKLKSAVKAFVLENLLSDVETVARYGPQTALYLSQDKKLKTELRRNFVFKFLSLVLILDVTRTQRLLPFDGLFAKESIYKSSKDVLLSFCRCFLRGEGDFMRHLALIHYSVSFTQNFVDEFEFAVTNLAVDLRDGVRLARLMDLLTNDKSQLTKQLRVPAVSRLQKLHNVDLVVSRLDWTGEKPVEAKHVVDGNKSMSLVLLWKIMFAHELKQLITPAQVMGEVQIIRDNNSWRRSSYDGHDAAAMAVRASSSSSSSQTGSGRTSPTASTSDDLSAALLVWGQTIAQNYDIPVTDLTASFADGRALCLLVHYYHPAVLPTASIKKTTHSLLESLRDADRNDEELHDLVSKASVTDMQKALNGERRNYLTLKKACKDIGGIPLMLSEFDSRHVPEERAMVAFLIYLFVRLTESSQQVSAAIRIQRQVRKRLCIARVHSTGLELEPVSSAELIGTTASTEREADDKEKGEVEEDCDLVSNMQQDDVPGFDQLETDSEPTETDAVAEDFVNEEDVQIDLSCSLTSDAMHSLESQNRDLESRLAQEVRDRINAELNAKLEMEKQLLLTLEMKVLEASEDSRVQAVLAESEAQQLAREQTAQRHRDALEAAKLQAERELEERLRVEALLRESLAVNEKERLAASGEIQQRMALEQQLHEQRQADLAQVEAERSSREAEKQARLLSEALIQQEMQARSAVEAQMAVEIEKRKALEARLESMERSRLQHEEALHRAETEQLAAQLLRRRSACIVQRIWRSCVEYRMKITLLAGVSRLQAVFRGGRARRVARCALLAVQILQSTWRRKQCAKILIQMNKCAAAIQSTWRQHAARAVVDHRHFLRRTLQNWLLGRIYRIRFNKTVRKTVVLQSLLRKCRHVWAYQATVRCIVRLQAAARRYSARRRFLGAKASVAVIQKAWRLKLLQMQNNVDYCVIQRMVALQSRLKDRCCVRIVTFMRKVVNARKRVLAAAKIARWYLSLLPLVRVRKLCRGFRRLGAVRRARKVRKTSSAALQTLRRRIKDADCRARADPSLKLGKQTSAALKVLQSGKMISQLLKACQTLELSTSLSKYCCEAFAQAGAPDILFSLLRSCNRSTPHQELLRVALVVLLHVARHDHLAAIVATSVDSAESLVDLIQMFRDKKSLFILATELLARLVNASDISKSSCNSPVIRKRLEGILHIMERKNRLEVRVLSVGSSNKSDASRSVSAASGSPSGAFAKYKGKAYKSIEPITCIQHLMQLLEPTV
eukprot:gene23201-29397_t